MARIGLALLDAADVSHFRYFLFALIGAVVVPMFLVEQVLIAGRATINNRYRWGGRSFRRVLSTILLPHWHAHQHHHHNHLHD